MTSTITSNSYSISKAALVLGFLMTQFMFFLDEGYYDLRWMLSFGNWLAFVVYFVVVSLVFYGIIWLATRFSSTKTAIVSGAITGVSLVLIIVFTLFRS